MSKFKKCWMFQLREKFLKNGRKVKMIERKIPDVLNQQPINIGSRVEMFVDKYLIDKMFDVSLKLHHPVKENAAIKYDSPWEGAGSGQYPSAFFDGERYRFYYRATSPAVESKRSDYVEEQYTCLAFSDDGIHWEKPELGIVEFNGNKNNNIVFEGVLAHNFTPFLDTNPNCKPEEKFKAIAGNRKTGLRAFASADGIHWEPMSDDAITRDGQFDSQNLAFYDPNIDGYVLYSRYFAAPIDAAKEEQDGSFREPGAEGKCHDLSIGIRAIQSAISPDLLHWSTQTPNSYRKGVPLEQFYTNATTLCPGAEHMYISSPMRFMYDRHRVASHPHPGVSDGVLLTSRDGVHFERTFMEGWIRPDLSERSWTQRNYPAAFGILETSPEEFSIYVMEHYEWDDCCARRFSIRRHGFASVNAPYAGGKFVTKPFIFTGKELHLNYATSAAGHIRVGIVDDGTRWPACDFSTEDCDIIYGNDLDRVVTWKGSSDLSQFEGKAIRLRFDMKDADLFAIQFK